MYKYFSQLFSLLFGYDPSSFVYFIAQEHNDHIFLGILSNLAQPRSYVIKASLIGHVVEK